jgi:hypothetical protein
MSVYVIWALDTKEYMSVYVIWALHTKEYMSVYSRYIMGHTMENLWPAASTGQRILSLTAIRERCSEPCVSARICWPSARKMPAPKHFKWILKL